MTLTISRTALNEIRRAAAADDVEICGLLLGRGGDVERVVPCANIAPDPQHAFEIDPAALVTAYRAARAGGPLVIGHYHSHPGGDASPSARDAAGAEEGSYWIIAGATELRCWQALGGGKFADVRVVACDNR